MQVIDLSIPEVKLIKPRRFDDKRGFFQQTYHYKMYADAGIDIHFVQDNWSRSTKGVLRGLHYQRKYPQAKLISIIQGSVFDVAVDLRKKSPTFGQWVGETLSAENGHQLYVPEGFAHGFLVLSDRADFVYKCSNFHTSGDEYGIIWNDVDIGIHWPEVGIPILSEKDAQLPRITNATIFD